jgi:hypothetical protein
MCSLDVVFVGALKFDDYFTVKTVLLLLNGRKDSSSFANIDFTLGMSIIEFVCSVLIRALLMK